jgi:hypothetical protein
VEVASQEVGIFQLEVPVVVSSMVTGSRILEGSVVVVVSWCSD